jgi:hypothetical protein
LRSTERRRFRDLRSAGCVGKRRSLLGTGTLSSMEWCAAEAIKTRRLVRELTSQAKELIERVQN